MGIKSMERLLGEPARADEVQVDDLVWHEGGWRKVESIAVAVDNTHYIELFDSRAGRPGWTLELEEDGLVLRGWGFLVARRVKYVGSLET